jgi:Ca-activated chloride channel family protein
MGKAALLSAVLCHLLCLAAPQAPQVFRAGVDVTTFGVTVTDRKGNIVTDLTRDDFHIVEDGKPQTIRYFARGEGETQPELHLGLMLDASGSMQNDMKLAQSAAIKFLNMLPSAEDITLVDFDTRVRITQYPQRDFARLVERIRQRKPDGWTALYDALGTYLDGAQQQDGRKILVMYTDGGDTRSALRFGETLDLLKASQVTVYAIGLVDNTGGARAQLQWTTWSRRTTRCWPKSTASITSVTPPPTPPPTAPGARWR